MSKIVVVYFSGYGHTKRLAEVVAESASAYLAAVDAEGSLADDAWDQLNAADAIIFGAPTYMGTVPWQFKKFMDTSSKQWLAQQWKDKLAAGFTLSASMNGDKQGVLTALLTFAMQHGMLWASVGIMPSSIKTSQRNDINYLGSTSGLLTQVPADAGADEIPPGDLETAKLFAQRIVLLAARLTK